MLSIDIPGYKKIEARHLVLDFNGTLAIDGKFIKGTRPLLEDLSSRLNLHILTADTFGTTVKEVGDLSCRLEILGTEKQDRQKEDYVLRLGRENVIAIGNGQNDMLMLRQAALGIVVMQQEGAFSGLLGYSGIICNSITDALNLLLNPLRIVATLRK